MGRRRERAVFWAVAAALVAVAAGAYVALLGRAPGAPPAPDAPRAVPADLRVAESAGPGFVVRRNGTRLAAVAGTPLGPNDTIATEGGARVVVAAGDRYQVTIDGEARVSVEEITEQLSRFRLDAGLVSARVRDDPARSLEISGGGDAVARTRGGEVAVSRSGDAVAVGVTRGRAELSSAGGVVLIRAGEQARASAGRKPEPAAPLPRSLLLKVTWPEERATNRRHIVVTGQTDPGAHLSVGGRRVAVGPDGRFRQEVFLEEGAQRVTAVARDLAGHRVVEESPPIVLDTRAPDARFETQDLWRPPPAPAGR